MSAPNTRGYDTAQDQRDHDDLGRWRLGAEIVEVILSTPPDWSARIGIFGKWGEGKSTVLRFAEQMLKEKGSVVFSFNPWAIQTLNDLWEDFGSRLFEALSTADIPFDSSWKKALKDSGKWLESKGLSDVADSAAALLGKDKVYNAAFGALSRWLKYDGAQIHAIREKLGDRRLVVLIDDLDRCAPQLIPQLLLSLRELLDLPGFTFVLAFDDEIVGRALTGENPAWVVGSDFLEKILDFRFYLPVITEAQKKSLVCRAISRYCNFVPPESVQEVLDLLPNNPRKLKSLIRSMAALKPQVSRHDPDELNWVDMWLAQMLRLESYAFFERLLDGDTLEKVITLYRALKSLRDKTEKDAGNQELRSMFKTAGIENTVVIDRLTVLIEAARSRASSKFSYICGLAVRPHAVTWKEFRSLYSIWRADRRTSVLKGWIEKQANNRSVGTFDVKSELFDAIIRRRNECLSAAAESASVEEHELKTHEAETLLEMVEQYLQNENGLGVDQFRAIYGQAAYWIAFRKNPNDAKLRELEENLILRLLSSASDQLSTELLEVVVPNDDEFGDIGAVVALRRNLRTRCVEIVEPKAASEAIAFITREGSIKLLTERNRFQGVRYCLFNANSSIWKSELRNKLLTWVRTGREDTKTYANVRDFFNLLIQGLNTGLDSISMNDIKTFLSDEEFVGCLWSVVTSRDIQYRLRITFVRARQSLIENGISDKLLPLTEELQSRLDELKTGPTQNPS